MECSDVDGVIQRGMVQQRLAGELDAERNSLFEGRSGPVAQQAVAANLHELVSMLKVDHGKRLHRTVAEAMTISETGFFRDVCPFEVLRKTVLPDVIERRKAERRLRIWSAACSTGQEAYSVAMLLVDNFPALKDWDVRVIGTDLSWSAVSHACQARYGRLEVSRGLPATSLTKYFERDGDAWVAKPEIRRLCEFQAADLTTAPPPLPSFDVVLLRNVLLYFSPKDRRKVFDKVYRTLMPQGYLLLGNAEEAEDSSEHFQTEFAGDCYFYRPVTAL